MAIRTKVDNYIHTNLPGTIALRAYVQNNVYDGNQDMIEKLAFYRLAQNFYDNKHWSKNNNKLLSFNYVKAIINKVNEFTLGSNGFEINVENIYGFTVSEKLEQSIEANINYVWAENKKAQLLANMFQMGGVTGDLYVYVYPDITERMVKLSILDSKFTTPIFEKGNTNDVAGHRYSEQLGENPENYIQKITEYRKDRIDTYYIKELGKKEMFELTSAATFFDMSPVVHIENKANAFAYGGYSDVVDILKLNKVYNELAEDVKSVIDYYGTPVTVITGATVGELKRGVGQIWSGLPSDANVRNLSLNEDLGSNMNFMELIKKAMHDLTGVPEEIMSKVQHISNTSSAALKMLYHPLVMAADNKAITYKDGITEINKRINIYSSIFAEINPLAKAMYGNLTSPKDIANYKAVPVFSYGFPNDTTIMLQDAQMELQNKIGSRREVMERLGKKNIPKIMGEIAEDVKLNAEKTEPKLQIPQKKLRNNP